jgi:hypothetical protein
VLGIALERHAVGHLLAAGDPRPRHPRKHEPFGRAALGHPRNSTGPGQDTWLEIQFISVPFLPPPPPAHIFPSLWLLPTRSGGIQLSEFANCAPLLSFILLPFIVILHNAPFKLTQPTGVKQNALCFMHKEKDTQPSQSCSGVHITPNPT